MKQYKRHIDKTDKHNYDSYEEYSFDSYDYQDDQIIDDMYEKEMKLWYKKEYLPYLERQNKINEIMDEENNNLPLVSNWPQSLEDMEHDHNWNDRLDRYTKWKHSYNRGY